MIFHPSPKPFIFRQHRNRVGGSKDMWGLQISALVVFWKGQLTPMSGSGQRLSQESSLPSSAVRSLPLPSSLMQSRALQEQKEAMGPSSISKEALLARTPSHLGWPRSPVLPPLPLKFMWWGNSHGPQRLPGTMGESALVSAPTLRPLSADLYPTFLGLPLSQPLPVLPAVWPSVSMCSSEVPILET